MKTPDYKYLHVETGCDHLNYRDLSKMVIHPLIVDKALEYIIRAFFIRYKIKTSPQERAEQDDNHERCSVLKKELVAACDSGDFVIFYKGQCFVFKIDHDKQPWMKCNVEHCKHSIVP